MIQIVVTCNPSVIDAVKSKVEKYGYEICEMQTGRKISVQRTEDGSKRIAATYCLTIGIYDREKDFGKIYEMTNDISNIPGVISADTIVAQDTIVYYWG